MQLPPNRRDILDQYWIDTVLSLIGENFEPAESDDIAGIVMNVRKGGNRVALWTISSKNESLQMSIGSRWRQDIMQTSNQLEYFTFNTLSKGGGGRKKHTYSL